MSKTSAKNADDQKEIKIPKKRRVFPTNSFEEAFNFTKVIYKIGAGQKVRRLTVFEHLNKSPDSGPSRGIITSCNKYGLITGSYGAEFLEITPKGKLATNDEIDIVKRTKAKFELSIFDIDIYKKIYEKFAGNKLPNLTVVGDILKEMEPDLEKNEISAIVDTFIVNLKYIGLLKTIAGAERVITIQHFLEELIPNGNINNAGEASQIFAPADQESNNTQLPTNNSADSIYENICFYITPIGDEDSEHRRHSNLFLESIIEPALAPLNLKVVRADKIDKPGTITKQIIEYILKSKLVIADLSYHNPNVFYELALRHACRLPTVQIIRRIDKVPFDVGQSRTIIIDTTDIYSLVPKLEIYKSEIANQARQALNDSDNVDNPVINVFPKLRLKLE